MANCERTFIAIKPDRVQRGLVGEIIKHFEQKGFRLVGLKFMQASEDLLKEHYIDLKDRPFFVGLVKYMHSGFVVSLLLRWSLILSHAGVQWHRCWLNATSASFLSKWDYRRPPP
uniref:Nucleoside diphosphate kinase A n=1 Tax=Macaca nemestrina TaxID=9545 RepID=A0A2K6B4X3_MACNE